MTPTARSAGRGALSARAERLFEAISADGSERDQTGLPPTGDARGGEEDTRRRVARNEFDSLGLDPEAIDRCVDAYGRHRLLTFDREPATREPTVEIAHEALLGAWARLRALDRRGPG